MKFRVLAVLVAVLAFAAVPTAHAATLSPGGGGPTTPPDSYTISSSATVLASIQNQTINSSGGPTTTVGGTYSTWVLRDPNNPFGANDLTFVYQFNNTGGAPVPSGTTPTAVERISVGDFGVPVVDAATQSGGTLPAGMTGTFNGGTGVQASYVDRGPTGLPVGFAFPTGGSGGAITVGSSSRLLIVATNATSFTTGTFAVIDSTTSTNLGYQPTFPSGVPEPASVVMMGLGGLGVGALALVRRRKVTA
jgi:hypothetical protein